MVDWLTNNKFTEDDINYLNTEYKKYFDAYQPSQADSEILTDPYNLTDNQIEELSQFSNYVINDLKMQLGLPKNRISKGSIKFVQDVDKRYVQDWNNGTWDGSWHDVVGINEISKETGLRWSNSKLYPAMQYYEGATSMYVNPLHPQLTFNDLKKGGI